MKTHIVLAGLLVLAAVTAQAQTVKVEFLMGKVNLTAQNASLRSIINEWSRVGGTRIINPERLAGTLVTLQLTDVPERLALDILLRGVAGYMVGSRETLVPGVSAFDRLVVVTAASGPAARLAPPAPVSAAPSQPVRRPPVRNAPATRPAIAASPEPDIDSDRIGESEPDEPALPQGGAPDAENVPAGNP